MLAAQLGRELRLLVREPAAVANPLGFYLVVVSLFPLGVSPDPEVLRGLAGGVVWVAALLASLLAADGLFRRDFEDGTLEQLVLTARPLFLAAGAKVLAHWLVVGLPLAALAPLLGGMLGLDGQPLLVLALGVLLGTPTLFLLAATGAALTTGVQKGGVLLSLLVLPLYIPVLVLGAGAVQLALDGLGSTAQLLLLAALASLAATLAPFAISAGLRISLEQS